MIPEKIGRYEIKSELGRGGMATVYRGYDPRFEREVAVKVLPSELLHSDPQFKLRFEREAKIIASLEHPSIVPVYDVGDEGGQPYFVMRYMNGGSLSERIKNKVMSIQEAARILGQIAPGMDEAHAKGIVHRDLKPSNILFDSKDTPYISDFGIAKLSQSQASSVTGSGIIGTPAYMAPEQASGEGVDGRSDIYALGIILFEMLTGRQPYEADTPMAVAIKHITDPVPRILDANPNLPPDVENIIQVAMAKSKNDRFATAVEMVDALRNIDKPETKTQMRTRAMKAKTAALPATRIGAQPVKKSFNVLAIIIPLVVVLVLVGGGYFIFNSINRPVETEAPVLTSTTAPVTATSEPSTEAPVVPVEPSVTPTDTPVPATDTPAAPQLPVLGGADKIALVSNNEIWLINVDGSDPKQLTFDGATKNDLQWLDHDTILFLSGKVIKYYKLSTDVVDTLTSFNSAASLDAFRVSHDGKQVMIAMSNEIFVVPFDLERMKTIKSRGTFFDPAEKACILPLGGTKAAFAVREARWSADDKLVAWLYKGVSGDTLVAAEQIMVLDVTACDPSKIDQKDNFPGSRFVPVGYQTRVLTDFDWDGNDLFAFNTERRNSGWGEFYLYNWITHKPTLLYPVNKTCCYRDARWSPDGTYILFAFQDLGLGPNAKNQLYYVPAGELGTGAIFKPLPLPGDFFKNPKEAPQPALRPAQ
ncbi:MAG: serine/threonine protein kinase [Anaerolineales bacterium]|nr:serine/threonine protein kinase [Anaerolineales bacterium]